jgi:hypothetical protein
MEQRIRPGPNGEVAAGVSPAVEPGVPPGGPRARTHPHAWNLQRPARAARRRPLRQARRLPLRVGLQLFRALPTRPAPVGLLRLISAALGWFRESLRWFGPSGRRLSHAPAPRLGRGRNASFLLSRRPG